MKTLEEQLAEYGRQRREARTPFTTEVLNGRPAAPDPIVSYELEPEFDVNLEPVFEISRFAENSSRVVPRRLAGWHVGVAIATITLLGFGLVNVLAGSGRSSDTEGTLAGSSNEEAVRRHLVNVDGVVVSLELPTGWESPGDFLISKDVRGDQAADTIMYFATYPGGPDVALCRDLPFGQLPERADIDVIARSLSPQVDYSSVGGLTSRFVGFQLGDAPSRPPSGAVFAPSAGCDPGYLYSWAPQSGGASWTESKAGDFIDAWFVNVDGTVLVIVGETRGLTLRRETEILQIVDSIRFPSIVPAETADYIIDINTGETTLLPATIRSLAPSQYSASPDGHMVAFLAPDSDGTSQLFVAGIDGAEIRQITHPPMESGPPAWSPDGSLIAYVQSEGLFVLDVVTGEPTQIPNVLAEGSGIQFTPDGLSIVYTDDAQLWIVSIDGGTSALLIGEKQGVEGWTGSLSPDGSMVTFLGNRIDGPGALRFLADTSVAEPHELGRLDSGNCGWVNPSGTWSPDGTRIVCAGGNEVRVVEVTTAQISFVAEGKGALWLDNHTLLVEAWGE